MTPNSFKHLASSLFQAGDWAAVDRAWHEQEGLRAALERALPQPLFGHVVQLRRGDPPKGIRGSQLTVVARNAAVAAKLRLALADCTDHLRACGWGIQHVRVTTQRAQDIAPDLAPFGPPRMPIPESAKGALEALAEGMENSALRSALLRISRRKPAGRT